MINKNPAITLMFRFSRGLYARDSSTTCSITGTVKGCGTRELWANGLRVAWGNLAIFTHLEVWKWAYNHGCFTDLHAKTEFFTHLSRFFVNTIRFSLKREINRWCSPQKKWSWMHGLIICWLAIFFQVTISEHLEPFPRKPSNDAQGMEAWSINKFWKYFAKKPWKMSTLQRCQLNENTEAG